MATKQPSELTVITKSKDLCSYIMTVTQKSPKHFRYTFVNRLQNLSLDIVEKLIRANEIYVVNGNKTYYNQRLNLQRDAMTDLKLLMYFSELSMNQEVILMKQYQQICELGTDTMNLLKAWISSDRNRLVTK